jgi:hypothetical protein
MLAASLLFCETCKSEYWQQLDMQVAVSGIPKYSVFLAAMLVKYEPWVVCLLMHGFEL